MMLRRSVILWAGALALACGGKSEIMPPPSSGGAAGVGAVGGGGAGGGGFGGGGYGGGGYGGGGFGGGGFGGGGAPPGGGGFGGGGFGGGPPGGGGFGGGPGSLAQQVCQKLDKVCPVPDCLGEIKDGMDLAAQYGCLKEYENVLICALQTPIQCSGGDPELSPMCQKPVSEFEDCISGPSTCSMSGGPGVCSIQCSDWGAKCAETTGGLYCTCTFGPKGGQSVTFGNLSCSGNWDGIAETFCN